MEILSGRYGPYVKHGRTNASLPKGEDVDAFTMDAAVALLAARAAKGKSRAKPARGRKKAKTDGAEA